MKSPQTANLLTVAIALVVAGGVMPSSALAWSLASQPVDGILLLKNGNILRGKIQQQGDHYHVHLPNGKLQVRERQVDTVCENVEAVYQYRRQQRSGSTADSHLDMAGWCLRHELYDHAAEELDTAASIDADHGRLGLLRRQLKQSVRMAELRKQQDEAVANVEPEKPLNPATLEKAPKWARALFVRQIQPLIVHSCATSGCHQSSEDSSFRLNRLALDGAGHPGVTLRNLAATLEQIDWEQADKSQLLALARQAHGGEDSSVPLPSHKLQVLQSWVSQLAEAHQQTKQLVELPQVADVEPPPITPTLQLNAPRVAPKQSPVGVRTASYAGVDAFDPMVFNDRYATSAQPPAQPPVHTGNATEEPVPHVAVPSDPQVAERVLIPLPATE